MDYEKAYKDSLEKARYILHTVETAGCAMHKDLLEEIFPELRESEDERIRRGIIQTLEFACAHKLVGVDDVLKMKAYLEKQKDSRPKSSDNWKPSEDEPEYYQHFDPDC